MFALSCLNYQTENVQFDNFCCVNVAKCQLKFLNVLKLTFIEPKMSADEYTPLLDGNNRYYSNFRLKKKELLELKVNEYKIFKFQASMIRLKIIIFRRISLKKTEKSIQNGEEHFAFHFFISFPSHIYGKAVFCIELKGREYNASPYSGWENNSEYSINEVYSTVSNLMKAKEEEDLITINITNHNFHILEARQQNIIHNRLVNIENLLLEMKNERATKNIKGKDEKQDEGKFE